MLWYNLRDVFQGEKGQGMVEYAYILGFVALLAAASFTSLSGGIVTTIDSVRGAFP